MSETSKLERFLEPVFLNEQMVLNCAAYLFKGVALESETSESSTKSRGVGVSIGVPLLHDLLSIDGGFKSGSDMKTRSARRYTSGGLHMAVLDELRDRKMVKEITASSVAAGSSLGVGDSYVDFHVDLRPSEYFSLIGTIKIMGPLVAQVVRDFGDQLLPAARSEFFDHKKLQDSVDSYEHSLMSLVDKLEKDYLTSNQLEMIMWSTTGQGTPIGVVDLDVSDYLPSELRAKLSGGTFHVIGKVIGKVERGNSLDLMQKTILSNAADLINRMLSLTNDQQELEAYKTQIENLRFLVQKLISLEVKGPAIRVAAMSVCI